MNCMPFISSGLLLIAIAGGTALLIKANKEGLGTAYKVIAYFVIIYAFLALTCCLFTCMMCRPGGGSCSMSSGSSMMSCHGMGMCRGMDKCNGMGTKCCKEKRGCGKMSKCRHNDDEMDDMGMMGRCGKGKKGMAKDWDEMVKDTVDSK